ncbi:MAG: hypothetical protein ABFD44_04430 [Anaerolineaceae bacterium]
MDWTTLLISALIFATIGYVAGGLVSTLRNRDAAEESEKSLNRIEETEPSGTAPVEAKNRPAPLFAVFRDQKGSLIRIDMNGKPVVASNALTPDQMGDLRRLHTDLGAWMGPPLKPSAPVHSADAGEIEPAPVSTPAVRQTGPLSTRLGGTPPQPAAVEVEPVAPTSMVGQINEILQKIIAGTDLEKRGVRLVEAPTRGVEVWVGAFKYEGVDQVPEDNVRKAIQTAVTMWENKRSV